LTVYLSKFSSHAKHEQMMISDKTDGALLAK